MIKKYDCKRSIAIGISSFLEIRKNNSIYVDKTDIIQQILEPIPTKVSLITRPRRFGKTLMLSVLSEFFDIDKNNKDLFIDLKIYSNKELCKTWMNNYPVISITFKDMCSLSFSDCILFFIEQVRDILYKFSYILSSDKIRKSDSDFIIELEKKKPEIHDLKRALLVFLRAIYSYHRKNVILLIDEYDVPLIYAWKCNFYEEMIDFLRSVLSSALKDNPYLNFGLLTGCLRVPKESIFTGVNNFRSYSISDTKYSSFLYPLMGRRWNASLSRLWGIYSAVFVDEDSIGRGTKPALNR
ncbi:MAG: AAA family ATPase [Desulfovibrionaceae bacterium]|nr:AAA family ATPase [Desulfovibrionaceae bacterium]